MSDDGEKRFDATPSRIAKAKREGTVVRAQEFGGIAAFGAAAVTLGAVIVPIAGAAREALLFASGGRNAGNAVTVVMLYALMPLCAGALAGTFAAIVQSGGVHVTAVVPKFERVMPLAGLKRIFSGESVGHAVRAAIGVTITACSIVPAMRDLFAAAAQGYTPASVVAVTWSATIRVMGAIFAFGCCLALVEYGVARRSWLRSLRMTFEEFKREAKEQDGDPATRARRKALHRGMLRGAISRVKDAAFVVVNPTHVAVALDYRPPVVPVPVVLVRAIDDAALRVRVIAAKQGIPIVENRVLARALCADVEPGAAIPPEHFVAVAEIVCALTRSGLLT